jgi:hypothetical protein
MEQRSGSLTIPKGVGPKGVGEIIANLLLSNPFIYTFDVNARGVLSYRYTVKPGSEEPRPALNIEGYTPQAVVANADMRDVPYDENVSAHIVLKNVFDAMSRDRLYVTCFIAARNSPFMLWLYPEEKTQIRPSTLLGYPVYEDPTLPKERILLCASEIPMGYMPDTSVIYNIFMNGVSDASVL